MGKIILDNKKVLQYISEKDALVISGRKISKDIEDLEVKINRYETMEKRITAKVIPPKEMTDKGDALVKQVTALNVEIEKIAKEINKSKLDAIPLKMKEEHLALMEQREKCERERNKLALKVQKIKDKLIPLIKKEVTPLLKEEFDDIETAQIKDGKVVISTYNRLDEWKAQFRKK